MNPAQIAHGPFLVGVAINIFLYGIMVTQMYLYYSSYKSDHFWMKFFVGFLFLADTINTLFDFVYIYQALVNHFGDSLWLTTANWGKLFATDPVMTGLIGGSVQLFFAWRIYVLTKNPLVVSAVVLLSVAGFLGSVGTTIGVRMVPAFVQFQKFEVIVIIWLACAACADIIITTALVLHLRSQKSGFSATDDVIDRVIRLTMQTGLVTSLCAAVDLVIYLTITSGLHLLFNVPLAKLYTNSLMSSLNARGGWKYNNTSQTGNRGTNTQQGTLQRQSIMRPEVFVHVEEHELVDGDKVHDLFGSLKAHSEVSSHHSKDNAV
ncbi:hypothetical protein SCLCIDRAFT_21616 [Scleroderma citrinum Foug A]|uniref:DUF6534 domain-containing protein n=1 Tax=Scleroderma citrinum Foug A TaxID=1036808 RepID=A0A0C3EFY9_9AGAM|nr:hypothetical protein SCLCIDRAFT_21616 [Scleroderma citrinum Foug A]